MRLLSVSMQLKRSHRKPEECVSPVSAISSTNCRHLADRSYNTGTKHRDLEKISITYYKKSSPRTFQARGKTGLSCLSIRIYFLLLSLTHTSPFPELRAVFHNDKVDLAPFSTDRGGFVQ